MKNILLVSDGIQAHDLLVVSHLRYPLLRQGLPALVLLRNKERKCCPQISTSKVAKRWSNRGLIGYWQVSSLWSRGTNIDWINIFILMSSRMRISAIWGKQSNKYLWKMTQQHFFVNFYKFFLLNITYCKHTFELCRIKRFGFKPTKT